MAFTPQTGGGGSVAPEGLMQLLRSQAPMTYNQPNQIAREMSNPVPQDPYAADRMWAAGNAFNPNPDTNGEGYLPLGNIGSQIGSELGSGVEQQIAQTLVQSAMKGDLDIQSLLRAIASYTTVGEASGAGPLFMQQYQDAMPASYGSPELAAQTQTYPWLMPEMQGNRPQPGGQLLF